MPLLHKTKRYQPGDLVLFAEAEADRYLFAHQAEPEVRLALGTYRHAGVDNHFQMDLLGSITVIPYGKGGYRLTERGRWDVQSQVIRTSDLLLGRVSGSLDCRDSYVVYKYLKRVAKRYSSYLHELAVDEWLRVRKDL
jgi:hypothetical protein